MEVSYSKEHASELGECMVSLRRDFVGFVGTCDVLSGVEIGTGSADALLLL